MKHISQAVTLEIYNLMQNYVEKLKPNVGDVWRADELWLKIKGDVKYLFALMDDESRFCIGQDVAQIQTTCMMLKIYFRKENK
jgi:transposase-like protein